MTISIVFLVAAIISVCIGYLYTKSRFDKITLKYISIKKKHLKEDLIDDFKETQCKYCYINAGMCFILSVMDFAIRRYEINRNSAVKSYIVMFVIMCLIHFIHMKSDGKYFT